MRNSTQRRDVAKAQTKNLNRSKPSFSRKKTRKTRKENLCALCVLLFKKSSGFLEAAPGREGAVAMQSHGRTRTGMIEQESAESAEN